MADYEKMCAVLCGAVDGVIEPLDASRWHFPTPARSARRCFRRSLSMLKRM